MAKKPKKHASKQLTRKQASRLERERRLERILVWGAIIVGVMLVGVLVYGFVVEKVVKAREPVALVADVPITTADFQARVRFSRLQINNELQYWRQQQQALDPTDPSTEYYLEYIQGMVRDLESQLSPANALSIGEQTLEQLIQEELVRQEAQRRGITVTPEELQQQIEQFFGYERNPATPTPEPGGTFPLTPTDVLTTPVPTSTPLPTPTPMTEQAFRQRYNDYMGALKAVDISEQKYRSWIEASLLQEKLLEQMTTEVPPTADQVKLSYLTVDSEEGAQELLSRLDAGEDFQALVDEVKDDQEGGGYGAELDWLPGELLERRLDAELVDLALSLEVGEHSQPVPNQDGTRYTIIEVTGHEVRELDESMREQMGQAAFQEWLDAQQASVERRTYEDRVPIQL